MTAGTVFVLLLAAVLVVLVVAPLFRRDALVAERVRAAQSEDVEIESERSMVLTALRDLEDDRATGKVDQADHADMHGRLTARAIELMQRADALAAERAQPAGPKALPRSRPSVPEPGA